MPCQFIFQTQSGGGLKKAFSFPTQKKPFGPERQKYLLFGCDGNFMYQID